MVGLRKLIRTRRSSGWNNEPDAAFGLFQALALHEPSSVDRIAAQASLRIFSDKSVTVANCVRIAHIMAALGAAVPEGFRYVTKDLCLRDPEFHIVVDHT